MDGWMDGSFDLDSFVYEISFVVSVRRLHD